MSQTYRQALAQQLLNGLSPTDPSYDDCRRLAYMLTAGATTEELLASREANDWPETYVWIKRQLGAVDVNGVYIALDAAALLMDDDLRERAHAETAPCCDQEFIDRYCALHRKKFGEDFIVA